MDSPYDNRKRSPAVLWLGHCLSSPFLEDRDLVSSCYGGNSTSEKWPTFRYTKAHRLHDIKTLCDSCDKIDITALIDSGHSITLRNSFFEIARTASYCRFCSLIAQYTRGINGVIYEKGFLYTLGNRDAVDDGPVVMDFRHRKLNIRVPYPKDWPKQASENDAWDLGSFEICCDKGNNANW